MTIDIDALRETSIADIISAIQDTLLMPCLAIRGERSWHLECDGLALRVSDVQAEEPRAVQWAVAAVEAMRRERDTQRLGGGA